MKSKTLIGATVALATGLLALASTAVAAGPRASYRDANERGGPSAERADIGRGLRRRARALASHPGNIPRERRLPRCSRARDCRPARQLGPSLGSRRCARARRAGDRPGTRFDGCERRERVRLERGRDRSVVRADACAPVRREHDPRPSFPRPATRPLTQISHRSGAVPQGPLRFAAVARTIHGRRSSTGVSEG